jgi:endonuclease/exonuclease/phosphatase family metal-dependent hydrolase
MRTLLILLITGLTSGCATAQRQPAQSTSLRVMAYNIKHGRGMDGKVDLERVAEVIRKQNPDLVALQEIDQVCKRSGNQNIAAELGKMLGMDHRFGKFMDFQGGEYGMAVLSRLPIKETVRHQLPEGSEPRCALEIQVQTKDGPTLSFISIHNDWRSESIRLKQIQALLDGLKDRRHPVILAGDFNGERTDASMKLLENQGWSILKKSGDHNTFPSVEPRKEIDFFVVKGMTIESLTHKVIDERVASDHRPISAELKFQ